MRPFLLSQIIEELPETGIRRSCGRLLVEPAALHFHGGCVASHRLQPQRPGEPYRAALYKAFDVLPSDQRDMVAESLLIKLDQATAMAGFLFAHSVKNCRRRRKV